ncbi:transposase [Arthrobacter sp. efr-133-TYG-120]|uniref:transposase n=1 Tax=Arthrobacter sp. efr-133-TYG-120 TaxID=3040280 RepID=UPI00330674E5
MEASSGQCTRHRLNRGEDRALNRALHTVAITRIRCHAETRAYEARRTLQGKTHRDIRRCLKRTLAGTSTAAWKPRQPLIQCPRRVEKHRSIQWPTPSVLPERDRPWRPPQGTPRYGRR